MSMSASILAAQIKSNLADVTTASEANTVLGDTITSHILTNAEFTFAWTALQSVPPVVPSPPPDPVTIATGSFISLAITITPSGATDADSAMTSLQNQIIAGMTPATYNITDIGFVTTAGAMSSSGTVGSLTITPSGTSDGDVAMLELCTTIIDWVKALAPTTPCAGTRTAGAIVYTGQGVVTTIL